MTLPECLKAWLEATSKDQDAVATDGGLKPSQVSDIKNGKIDPRWSSIEKLAKGFGVSPAVFLTGPRSEGPLGHGDNRPTESSAVLERLRLEQLDAEAAADDSERGDILRAQHALQQAQAALNRALRRPNKGSGAA